MLSGVPLRPVNPIPRFAAMKRTIRRRLCCLLPALMTAGAIAATPPAAESGIARDFEWCSVAAPASLPPEARCTSPSRSTGMSTRKTSSLPATCTGCVPTAHGADFSPGHRGRRPFRANRSGSATVPTSNRNRWAPFSRLCFSLPTAISSSAHAPSTFRPSLSATRKNTRKPLRNGSPVCARRPPRSARVLCASCRRKAPSRKASPSRSASNPASIRPTPGVKARNWN